MQHSIHANQHHFGWDNSIPPEMVVPSGTDITVETLDSSAAQFGPRSTIEDLIALDFSRVNPVTGPIYVEGAEPGDSISITFNAFRGQGWGWTANIPGFGLLTEDFPEPELNMWAFDKENPLKAQFRSGLEVPLRPFVGTVGLALAESGNHSVIPPRHVGGNLDIRDMCVGTTIMLPVEVLGGLLSIGDTHAAQGDGEVCGTAIESPFDVDITIDRIKGAGLTTPRFITNGSSSEHNEAGWEVTTGVGPDLLACSKDAVSRMVELLSSSLNILPVEAYMLCSVAGHLRILEIVDMPNFTVGFYMSRDLTRI